MNPPKGVMPLRSPMPRIVVSMWVAPHSKATKELAIAQPVSLWQWNSMSQSTTDRKVEIKLETWEGEATPTVKIGFSFYALKELN